jgi:hypothetical protein
VEFGDNIYFKKSIYNLIQDKYQSMDQWRREIFSSKLGSNQGFAVN